MGIGIDRSKWCSHVVVVKFYDGMGNLVETRGYPTKGQGFSKDGTLQARWRITGLNGMGYLIQIESMDGEKIAEDVIATSLFLTSAVVEGGKVDDSELVPPLPPPPPISEKPSPREFGASVV